MEFKYSILQEDISEFENELSKLNKRANSHLARNTVEVKVIKARGRARDILVETPKDEIDMKPEQKKLTKEEKLKMLNKIAGKARFFDAEGLQESDRIANREDGEEDAE